MAGLAISSTLERSNATPVTACLWEGSKRALRYSAMARPSGSLSVLIVSWIIKPLPSTRFSHPGWNRVGFS